MIGNRHYILAWAALVGATALAWFGHLGGAYVSAIGVVLGTHFGASLLAARRNSNASVSD